MAQQRRLPTIRGCSIWCLAIQPRPRVNDHGCGGAYFWGDGIAVTARHCVLLTLTAGGWYGCIGNSLRVNRNNCFPVVAAARHEGALVALLGDNVVPFESADIMEKEEDPELNKDFRMRVLVSVFGVISADMVLLGYCHF